MIVPLAALILQYPMAYSIVPLPQSLKMGEGVFRLEPTLEVVGLEEFPNERAALSQALRDAGVSVRSARRTTRSRPSIVFVIGPKAKTDAAEGAYRLEVDPDEGIRLESRFASGAFYGIQTLRQMLLGRGKAPLDLPAVLIEDKPRFEWRGMLLDVSRHFFTTKEIKKLLDDMCRLKLNVFHWHLTDDGGWRMEVKRYPLLTEKGAWRTDISDLVWAQDKLEFPGQNSEKKLEGGFYSQKEIREIVQYAAERHITVVPEIEVPGHSLAAMEAYPEWGCDITQATGHAYRTNVYCAGKETTFRAVQAILDETMALFPSKDIHIGGDEVFKDYWSRCPKCKDWMAKQGLRTLDELQSDFIKRVEAYLNSKDRRMVGWDEILEGGLAPNAVVMSWRGTEGGVAAAKAGHRVVMSPTSHCYFDYSYETTPTEKVYEWEPVPHELTPEEAAYVRGGQANVWTEWIVDLDRIETLIYPRILATAECLWTEPSRKYWPEFQRRLEPHYRDFARRGLDFHVDRPEFEANLIVFRDECLVAAKGPSVPGLELKYSTDGKSPRSSSPSLQDAIRVDRSRTISAAYLLGGKRLSEVSRVVCLKGVPKTSPQAGLVRRMTGQRLMQIPDWGKLDGLQESRTSNFDISPFKNLDAFGIQWTGFLRIETEGLYTFTLGSDDGSRLSIAGAVVVDNDGPHAYLERSGKAYLLPGVYPFEVGFFESGGDERFEARVEGPALSSRPLEQILYRG